MNRSELLELIRSLPDGGVMSRRSSTIRIEVDGGSKVGDRDKVPPGHYWVWLASGNPARTLELTFNKPVPPLGAGGAQAAFVSIPGGRVFDLEVEPGYTHLHVHCAAGVDTLVMVEKT